MEVDRSPDGTFYDSGEYIMFEEGATQAQRDEARMILEALDAAYPGHPWAVRVYGDETGGGFFIKHLDFPANWGMNQPKAHLYGSSSEMKRDVILKAGEWLERANLRRGRATGDEIMRVDGVPEKYQPNRPLIVDAIEIVSAEDQGHRKEVIDAARQMSGMSEAIKR